LVAYLVAFLLGTQLVARFRDMRLAFQCVALTGAAVAAYGLVQSLGYDPIPWGIRWSSSRAFATMANPDLFGGYVVLTFFVSLGIALSETRARRRNLWWFLTLLQGCATIASFSRGAWIALLAGTAVFVVLAFRTKLRLAKADARFMVATAALVGAVAVFALGFSSSGAYMRAGLEEVLDLRAATTNVRVELGRIAIDATADRPLFGYGPDTFAVFAGPRATKTLASQIEPGAAVDSAHNLLLQTASELGLPGAGMLAVLIGWTLVIAWRWCVRTAPAHPDAAVLVAGGVAGCAGCLASLMFNPTNAGGTLVFWGVLGMLISPLGRPVRDASSPVAVRGLVVASLASMFVGVLAVLAAVSAAHTAAALNDPRVAPAEKLTAARRAMNVNPLSAEYSSGAAQVGADLLVASALADPSSDTRASEVLEASLGYAREAIRMQPQATVRRNVETYLLLLGAQYIDERYYPEARARASEALEVAPNDLMAQYWYARTLDESGDASGAVPVLRATLSLRPAFTDAALLLSEILVRSGDPKGALIVLERADPTSDDTRIQQAITRIRGGEGSTSSE